MLTASYGFVFREGTLDSDIFAKVVEGNEYALPRRMAGAVVLDVGAHIGSFALACVLREAAEIWCVEAQIDNARLCRRNLGQLTLPGLRHVLYGAAWRSDKEWHPEKRGETQSLPVAPLPADNTGGVWVGGQPTEGQTFAPLLRLDDLIEAVRDGYKRQLDILKLDIEGSEWPCLFTSIKAGSCKLIVGEYHLEARDKPAFAEWRDQISPDGLCHYFEGCDMQCDVSEPDDAGLGYFRAWQ